MSEGVQVMVSNISNEANQQQIKEYLSIVGPVKSCYLNRNGCKVSANVMYLDMETALMAVNYLGNKEFRGRELKINVSDMLGRKVVKLSPDQQIGEEITKLNNEEKAKILSLMSRYARQEGKQFQQFLARHEKITESLNGLLKHRPYM